MLIASFMLTFLAFAMLKVKGYEEKWRLKLEAAAVKVFQGPPLGHCKHALRPAHEGRALPRSRQQRSWCQAMHATCTERSPVRSSHGMVAHAACHWVHGICCSPLTSGVHGGRALQGASKHTQGWWQIALLAWTTTFREGLESFIFLTGVQRGASTPSRSPSRALWALSWAWPSALCCSTRARTPL